MAKKLTGYDLSRAWFDFCYENPEQIKPNHTALYFFIIEHCNRLGWKKKFGLPTTMAKEAIGIKSYNTYINTFNDLIEWKFITLIEKSQNQYSANIIALSNFNKSLNGSLDKALINHASKHCSITYESIDSIDKQETKKPLSKEQEFIAFWDLYNYKKGDKEKVARLFLSMSKDDRGLIMAYIPKYIKSQPVKKYRKHPSTFLNNSAWLDEIILSAEDQPKILSTKW